MTSRRHLLKAAALLSFGTAARRAEAKDYASASEVFAAIDRLEADVAGRLRAIARVVPAANPFVASVLADQERHRADRQELRRRLRVAGGAGAPTAAPAPTADLPSLRTAQEELMHAHAEGIPALGDRSAVDAFAHHLVDLSRQLTVIDLWIELESQRG